MSEVRLADVNHADLSKRVAAIREIVLGLDEKERLAVERSDQARLQRIKKVRRDNCFKLLQFEYSLGTATAELQEDLIAAGNAYFDVENFSLSTVPELPYFEYGTTVQLLSWAVMLDDSELVSRLEAKVTEDQCEDFLLAALFGHRQRPDELVYAEFEIHDGLKEVVLLADAGDVDAASERLFNYVDTDWLRGNRKGSAAWLDRPDARALCYEAAAISVLFGLDDSALEGHRFYPYDFAQHRR